MKLRSRFQRSYEADVDPDSGAEPCQRVKPSMVPLDLWKCGKKKLQSGMSSKLPPACLRELQEICEHNKLQTAGSIASLRDRLIKWKNKRDRRPGQAVSDGDEALSADEVEDTTAAHTAAKPANKLARLKVELEKSKREVAKMKAAHGKISSKNEAHDQLGGGQLGGAQLNPTPANGSGHLSGSQFGGGQLNCGRLGGNQSGDQFGGGKFGGAQLNSTPANGSGHFSGVQLGGQFGGNQFGGGQLNRGQLGGNQFGGNQFGGNQFGNQFGGGQFGSGHYGGSQFGGQFGHGQVGGNQFSGGQFGGGPFGHGQLGGGPLGHGQLGSSLLGYGQLGGGSFGCGPLYSTQFDNTHLAVACSTPRARVISGTVTPEEILALERKVNMLEREQRVRLCGHREGELEVMRGELKRARRRLGL